MQLTKALLPVIAALAFSAAMHAQEAGTSGTYMYSRSESAELFLSFLGPAEAPAGKATPLIIFISEAPHEASALFRGLSEAGYSVASVACREIPAWQKAGSKFIAEELSGAVTSLSEDVCAATRYLVDNAEALGVDPKAFVLAGASTGAVTALQTEWELCNGGRAASLLPAGFRFAGIISFAGALAEGSTRYSTAPAPTMLLHGTADKVIGYSQTRLGKMKLPGSSTLAQEFASKGYSYWILRFEGLGHEVSESMDENLPEVLRFLECNVAGGGKRIVDATVIL